LVFLRSDVLFAYGGAPCRLTHGGVLAATDDLLIGKPDIPRHRLRGRDVAAGSSSPSSAHPRACGGTAHNEDLAHRALFA
jgi:hypothetical protein